MTLDEEKKVLYIWEKHSSVTELFSPWEYNKEPAPCLVLKQVTYNKNKEADKGKLISRGWSHIIYENKEEVEIMVTKEEALQLAKSILEYYD